MTVRWETAQAEPSPMRVYVGAPDSPGPHPALVVAHHAPGIDAQVQDAVHRLVRAGYAAAAPDLFRRQPQGVEAVKRTQLLRDDEILADLRATIAHLKSSLGARLGPLGVMGYCMGGRVAYLGACEVPEFAAAAVFYGGNIMKALGDGPSPFERSSKIRCPVIGFFGDKDVHPSPEIVNQIDAELTKHGVEHDFHRYADAGHGFQNPARITPEERQAAADSWSKTLSFLSKVLPV